jgi:FKBP-type peptidyl-prolyl cis-trans isomerase SlyD
MPPSSTSGGAALKSGDLVLLDYEIWAEGAEKRELVDTTREEAAQKAEVKLPEGTKLEPRPHLVGGDYFPSGIESALVGAAVGSSLSREFPPAEAFGERDPKLIELFSMHEISRLPEMRREDAELNVGTVLTIKGRRGRVVTLTAARVRVDFNPPFAGRKIQAEFKALSRIEDPKEQARAIVELSYGHGKEFEVRWQKDALTLRLPERAKFDFAWLATKPKLIERLRAQLHPTSIELVEEFVTPAAKEPAPAPSKGSAPGAPSTPHEHPGKGEAAKPAP